MKVDDFVQHLKRVILRMKDEDRYSFDLDTATQIIERQRDALNIIGGMATIETVNIQKRVYEALNMEV